MKIKINKAFTLIEILIVISIIGILTSLAVVSYTVSQKQARDVERKSDLSQYRTALENYANTHDSLYPVLSPQKGTAENLCELAFLNITSCPIDPKDPHVYYYFSNSTGTFYVLWSYSETKSTELVTKSWVVCSSGQSGYKTGSDFAICPDFSVE